MFIGTSLKKPRVFTKRVFKGAVHQKFCPFASEIKNVDQKKFTLTARASTITIDRDREIVLPSAFEVADFLKQPMFLWNHEWYGQPEDSLGTVLGLRTTETSLIGKFAYVADVCERANLVWKKVTHKYRAIRGFSVGFRMLEWVTARDSEDKINALPLYAREALKRGDVYLVHTKVQLLEISQVLISSNPDSHTDEEDEGQEVDGLLATRSADKEEERIDDMDLSKLTAEVEKVNKSLESVSANQGIFADAIKSVTANQLEMAKLMEGMQQAKAAPAPPAPVAPPAPEVVEVKAIKTLADFEEVYPELFTKFVGEVTSAVLGQDEEEEEDYE